MALKEGKPLRVRRRPGRGRSTWTPARDERLKLLVTTSQMTWGEIGREFGLSPHTVRDRACALGYRAGRNGARGGFTRPSTVS